MQIAVFRIPRHYYTKICIMTCFIKLLFPLCLKPQIDLHQSLMISKVAFLQVWMDIGMMYIKSMHLTWIYNLWRIKTLLTSSDLKWPPNFPFKFKNKWKSELLRKGENEKNILNCMCSNRCRVYLRQKLWLTSRSLSWALKWLL